MSTWILAAVGAVLAVAAGWALERYRLGPPPVGSASRAGGASRTGREPAATRDPSEILEHLERVVRGRDADEPVSVVLFQLEGYEELEERGRRMARRYLGDVLAAVEDRLEERQRLGTLEEPPGRLLAVLPGATSAAASLFAERARINLDPVEPADGPPCPLSAGVVALSDAGAEPEALLEKAERALEQALRLGGDRVMVLRRDAFLEGPLRSSSSATGRRG